MYLLSLEDELLLSVRALAVRNINRLGVCRYNWCWSPLTCFAPVKKGATESVPMRSDGGRGSGHLSPAKRNLSQTAEFTCGAERKYQVESSDES